MALEIQGEVTIGQKERYIVPALEYYYNVVSDRSNLPKKMDAENRIGEILDNPRQFKALKDLVVYLKGGEESLDAMARKAAAEYITQWTPVEEYHQTNMSPAIYFVLLHDDYLKYQQIWTINKVFAKAFIMISAIYIGRDKTPKVRKAHYWGFKVIRQILIDFVRYTVHQMVNCFGSISLFVNSKTITRRLK